MAATYRLSGDATKTRIGWATKKDAAAVARMAVAGRVLCVDFGRLHGCQWVAVAGAGPNVRILAADGSQIGARVDWPTITITPAQLCEETTMTRAMHGGCNAARELDRLDGIVDDLRRHLAAGGRDTDHEVALLYRDYYRITRGELDFAAVRAWAARNGKPA